MCPFDQFAPAVTLTVTLPGAIGFPYPSPRRAVAVLEWWRRRMSELMKISTGCLQLTQQRAVIKQPCRNQVDHVPFPLELPRNPE